MMGGERTQTTKTARYGRCVHERSRIGECEVAAAQGWAGGMGGCSVVWGILPGKGWDGSVWN